MSYMGNGVQTNIVIGVTAPKVVVSVRFDPASLQTPRSLLKGAYCTCVTMTRSLSKKAGG
jgi:hypothetical protein